MPTKVFTTYLRVGCKTKLGWNLQKYYSRIWKIKWRRVESVADFPWTLLINFMIRTRWEISWLAERLSPAKRMHLAVKRIICAKTLLCSL